MPSGRSRAPPPLLLLLLPLSFGPGAGNEGGGVGNCWCPEKLGKPPQIATKWPGRLVHWEVCGHVVRFTFPKRQFCGLSDAPWVIELQNSAPHKRKGAAGAEAGEGVPAPGAPASTRPAPASVGPGGPATEEAPATRTATEAPTTAAAAQGPAAARSSWESVTELARVGPTHFPPQHLPAQSTKMAVICLLGVAVLSIAVAVGVACRRKRPTCRTPATALLPPEASDRKEYLCLHHWEKT